jgi:hypothetical protein
MNETDVLLHSYYEVLHGVLCANRAALAAKTRKLLAAEITKHNFGSLNKEKLSAYEDACIAFIDERIETYNPIGIQYTFDRPSKQQALELELQLNWYDSRGEFEALVEAARNKVQRPQAHEKLRELTDELIKQAGAYPDNTIIRAFEAEPALSKLCDYVVSRAIEEVISESLGSI